MRVLGDDVVWIRDIEDGERLRRGVDEIDVLSFDRNGCRIDESRGVGVLGDNVVRVRNIEDREDDTYEITGNIKYMFARWITFSGTAGFEKRDSNLAGYDYENTFFILKLAFAYDSSRK